MAKAVPVDFSELFKGVIRLNRKLTCQQVRAGYLPT